MKANPIGLIVTAIALFVAGIIALVKNFDKVKAAAVEFGKKLLLLLGPMGFLLSMLLDIEKQEETASDKRRKQTKALSQQTAKRLKEIQEIRDAEAAAHSKRITAFDLEIKRQLDILLKGGGKVKDIYDRTILGLVSDYAKAFTKDPANAFRALFTKEKLGIVKGNLVELERFYGIFFEDKGGYSWYSSSSSMKTWQLNQFIEPSPGVHLIFLRTITKHYLNAGYFLNSRIYLSIPPKISQYVIDKNMYVTPRGDSVIKTSVFHNDLEILNLMDLMPAKPAFIDTVLDTLKITIFEEYPVGFPTIITVSADSTLLDQPMRITKLIFFSIVRSSRPGVIITKRYSRRCQKR